MLENIPHYCKTIQRQFPNTDTSILDEIEVIMIHSYYHYDLRAPSKKQFKKYLNKILNQKIKQCDKQMFHTEVNQTYTQTDLGRTEEIIDILNYIINELIN